MADASVRTVQLRGWLERMRRGDRAALDELIRHVGGQLEKLTRQMLRSHPAVKRWAQTDDVLQGALLRLVRAVQSVEPTSIRAFFALATQQIRWELLDLARHYYGPEGWGANHASATGEPDDAGRAVDKPDRSHDPSALAEWREFHEHIDQLPEEEREVVGLLFYQGFTQAEAAELLEVTVRTVQRRWHAALVTLHRTTKGHWPGT